MRRNVLLRSRRSDRGRLDATGAVLGALCVLVLTSPLAASSAVARGGTISTVAGTGTAGDSGDGGLAVSAQLNEPRSIAVMNGGILFADAYNNVVRLVSPQGTISTVAGNRAAGFSGDGGPATAAQLNFPHDASPTPDGGYLIADTLNNRIRKVLPDGTITTVAGNGGQGYGGDGGAATEAMINHPRGVAALPDGGMLIPDSNNHRVRRVSPGGIITTVAGTGIQAYEGDGIQATRAPLSVPFSVAPTADGGFLIVDVGNHRIRKVGPSGLISTVAGTGFAGFSGDGGPATSAGINLPANVQALPDGAFVFADSQNHRVRRVDANGVITTIAGTGRAGFSGDGVAATEAALNVPKDVFQTTSGDVLIADSGNYRVRRVTRVMPPTGCVPGALNLVAKGNLVVGTDNPAFPPWFGGGARSELWELNDPATGKGYESAVAYAVAARLGFKPPDVVWLPTPLRKTVARGRKPFDFAISQLSPSLASASVLTFSTSYYSPSQAVVTLTGNRAGKVRSRSELRGYRLGAPTGASHAYLVKRIKPTRAVARYSTVKLGVAALLAKRIDGLVVDLQAGIYWQRLLAAPIVVRRLPSARGDESYRLVLQKGNSLARCLNKALTSLKRDGTLSKLQNTWLVKTTGIPVLK